MLRLLLLLPLVLSLPLAVVLVGVGVVGGLVDAELVGINGVRVADPLL